MEEKTRIKENKNGVSRMGLDEIIGLIGGSEPRYIIVLVALLGLAGRNRLHSFILCTAAAIGYLPCGSPT